MHTHISPEALAFIASRSGRSTVCSLDVDMENGMFDAMDIDMEENINVEMYLMNTMVRTMRSDAHNSHKHIDHGMIGEKNWHNVIFMKLRLNRMAKMNSPISHSQPICAHDVPQDQRSQDVRMTNVRFNDVIHTLGLQTYSEQYGKPLKQFLSRKHGVYITISRRACAYTGLTKDELMIRRMNMAKSGRWKQERSPKTDRLGDR